MESAKDLYQKYHEHKKTQPEIFENNMMRNLESLRKSINSYNSYGLSGNSAQTSTKKIPSQSVIWGSGEWLSEKCNFDEFNKLLAFDNIWVSFQMENVFTINTKAK